MEKDNAENALLIEKYKATNITQEVDVSVAMNYFNEKSYPLNAFQKHGRLVHRCPLCGGFAYYTHTTLKQEILNCKYCKMLFDRIKNSVWNAYRLFYSLTKENGTFNRYERIDYLQYNNFAWVHDKYYQIYNNELIEILKNLNL